MAILGYSSSRDGVRVMGCPLALCEPCVVMWSEYYPYLWVCEYFCQIAGRTLLHVMRYRSVLSGPHLSLPSSPGDGLITW